MNQRHARYSLALVTCLALICGVAQATVKPPEDWFLQPGHKELWQQMEPKLNNWEFQPQPSFTGTTDESLSGIHQYLGLHNDQANTQRGLSATSPLVYHYDLNMDGQIDALDVLELGYQDQPGHKRTSTAPSSGTNKWVVLRGDFTDEKANYAKYTSSYFNDYLFSDGTFSKQSCNDFYKQVSYGKLGIAGTIGTNGPEGDGWYAGTQNKAYYVTNGGEALLREAILASDASIDYSQYDVDHDGYVDTVMLFYPNAVFSGGLWPHRGSGLNVHVDGVIVDAYFITGTNDGDESWTMTITSHEYGHMLGWPDLYDVDYTSNGIGAWSLMAYQYDSNHKVPSPDPWCKSMLGWVTPKVITDNVNGYSLGDYQDNPEVLKLWTDGKKGDQYFLVANYQQVKTDTDRPGQGLMIFHIDDSVGGGDQDNADENHKHIDVESARGFDNPASTTPHDPIDLRTDLGNSQDPFFTGNGAAAYTGEFSNTSNPSSKDYPYVGNNTYVKVSNISAPATNMTMDIQVTSPNAPTCTITAPTSGVQSGTVEIDVTATPAGANTISKVDFYCNDAFLGSDSSSPYSLTFDSRSIYNGSRVIKAIATDNTGAIDTDTKTLTFTNSATALPFSDGFESGIGAWAVYDPSGDSRWTSQTIFSAGAKSAGIGSTTNGYDFNEHDSLVSIRFDLTGTTNPLARWKQRYRVTGGENSINVYVTKDDGVTLDRLATWTGSNLNWTPASIDLTPYVGQQVYLIFKLDSSTLNRSGGDSGWWLDEMQVKEKSTPPQILTITPGEGSNVTGVQTITVDATDDEGVQEVDFLIDGNDQVAQDLSSPFTFDWNSDWVFNGAHTFTAVAYDADKQSATATVNWTTTNNGTALPFSEDFNSLPTTWRVIDENGAGRWQFKGGKGYNNTSCMYMGINSNYDDNESDWFISPTFNIGAGADAGLGFLHRYDIEPSYDYAHVYVTTDLNTWNEVGLFSARNMPYASYGAPLTSYAGQKVKLAWYFASDGGLTYEGWYVDEIRVQNRPKVTAVSPNPVTNGQQLTITGTGFGAGLAHDFPLVTISGTQAFVVTWTNTTIKVTVPANIASGDVVVTNHGIASDPFAVKVKLPAPSTTGLGQL